MHPLLVLSSSGAGSAATFGAGGAATGADGAAMCGLVHPLLHFWSSGLVHPLLHLSLLGELLVMFGNTAHVKDVCQSVLLDRR